MDEFVNTFITFLFSEGGELPSDAQYPLLIFSLSSSFMGILVVVLDFIQNKVRGVSFLKLNYRGAITIWLFILWGVAAGIGGFLGAVLGILQLNRLASLTVGIAWPLILPRLIESARIGEDFQKGSEEEQ